jgi:hypothetical protein
VGVLEEHLRRFFYPFEDKTWVIYTYTYYVTWFDSIPLLLQISNKYGSLTRNKFLTKSVTTLKQHDVYSKYASLPRFQNDVCWLVKIQFNRRIDVWNWCLISRKISYQWCARLDWKPRLLRRSRLVGSLFQGSYTSIFITYSWENSATNKYIISNIANKQ